MGWIPRHTTEHRLFIAGVFVLAVIAHLFYLAPGGPSLRYTWPLKLVPDEGNVLYDSFRITCGEVIYRDFFQFQGPVFYYVNAGLFAITGPSMTAARGLNILVAAFSPVFIALLVSRSLGLVAGAAAAAVHIFLLFPMWPYAYPHWLAETLALAGIYLLAASSTSPRRQLAGGACLGLSAATIQSLGLPILATCIVTVSIPGILGRSWRMAMVRPSLVFWGALLVISPFVLYLGLADGLGQMCYAMFEWVFKHYAEGQKDAAALGYGAFLGSYIIDHARLARPLRDLAVVALKLMRLFPLLTICGATVAIFRVIFGERKQSPDDASLIIGIAAFSASLPIFLGITRGDLTHLCFIGSFGLCGAAVALSPCITWDPRSRLPLTLAWVLIGTIALANFSAKAVMTYPPSRKMQDWRGEVLKLPTARWIDENVGPGERVVLSSMAGLQYLYIRHSAVPFTFLPPDTIPNYFSERQWQELGERILKSTPPVVEMSQEQWGQVTQRTPELELLYRRNKGLLLRVGFIPEER
jgi:hypothetical protein